MKIPTEVYKKFAEKVYSCRVDTLKKEQSLRKRRLIETLKKQRDELIEGDVNQIHPSWIKEKRIENLCYKILKSAFYDSRNYSNMVRI